MNLKIASTCAILLGCSLVGSAQLVVDNSISAEDLVQNVLLGGGVTVSNVTFNGVPGNQANIQIGSFIGSSCNVGLPLGVVMSSGDVNVSVGPNNDGGATLGTMNGPGDVDLEVLLGGGFTTNDAAILEFDFIPAGDSLSFNYVFGSEEYLEWVNTSYNDVFGFFLSGPGISGPYSNNAMNIALVPGTSQPVSIDNVNDVVNNQYYVDNGDGFTAPNNTDPYYIQYDGFTTVLTAVALVECGETYHIKLAVADAGDAVLDSGVFLEAGSFSSPNSVVVSATTVSGDNTLIEGCEDAVFSFWRPDTTSQQVINYVIGGNAINGSDYVQIADSVVIPQGSYLGFLAISAIQDNLVEGTDTLTITAFIINTCGDTTESTASIFIEDYPDIELSVEDLNLDCSEDSVLISVAISGGVGAYSIMWNNGPTSSTQWVDGMANGIYTVTVTDECPKSEQATVTVITECDVFIPNVFTPNNDGYNDAFVIEGITGVPNQLTVYNRWGMVVFEATNYRSNWKAVDISDGTYYYVLEVQGHDPYTGHVTILAANK